MSKKLTSVKMQSVFINKEVDQEWYMPILRFGKGKHNEFKMNLYIKSENKTMIKKCTERIRQFINRDMEELKTAHDDIVQEFNEWKTSNHA